MGARFHIFKPHRTLLNMVLAPKVAFLFDWDAHPATILMNKASPVSNPLFLTLSPHLGSRRKLHEMEKDVTSIFWNLV